MISHSLKCTHTNTHTHTLTLTLMHTLTHTLTLTYTHAHTHTHTHTHSHSCTHSHTHSHSLTLMHTHTHTHLYIAPSVSLTNSSLGSIVTLTCTGTNNDGPVQWRRNGSVVTSTTLGVIISTDTLTVDSEGDSFSYDCVISNKAGAVASQAITVGPSTTPSAGKSCFFWLLVDLHMIILTCF